MTTIKSSIFYTLIDSEDNHHEQRVNFYPNNDHDGNITIVFPELPVSVDKQQLAELGSLLLALSGYDYDADSVDELLDGYDEGLTGPFKCRIR